MDYVYNSPINSWGSRENKERKPLSENQFKSPRRNSVGYINDKQEVQRQVSQESSGTERIERRNSMPLELDVDSFETSQKPSKFSAKKSLLTRERQKLVVNDVNTDELLGSYLEQQQLIQQLSDELDVYKEAVKRLLKERKDLVEKVEKTELKQIEKEKELLVLAKSLLWQKMDLDEQLARVSLKVDKIEERVSSDSTNTIKQNSPKSSAPKKKRFSFSFSRDKPSK